MEIDENGVVNPLRPPAVVRDALRALAGLPPIARAFTVLAILDVVAQIVDGRTFAPIMIARAMIVLLPVAVLVHRRDAQGATPDVFRGAVLVAVSEVAAEARNILATAGLAALRPDPFAPGPLWPVAAIAIGLVGAAGWWLVARAIAGHPPIPGLGRRIVAAAVAACALATGIGELALYELAPTADLGLLLMVLAATLPSWLAAARLGWVTITRAGRAPRAATWAAAAGAGVQAVGTVPMLGIALVVLVTREDAWIQAQAIGIRIESIAFVASLALFLVAFALGAGDAAEAGHPPAEPIIATG